MPTPVSNRATVLPPLPRPAANRPAPPPIADRPAFGGDHFVSSRPAPPSVSPFALNDRERLARDYGQVVGQLEGSIKAFGRINGSYDVYQWKSFCYMNFEALKDARNLLEGNPDLAAKAGIPLGVLTGAIQSFSSINGSFDVYQWKAFANSNRNAMQAALDALRKVDL